jgi:hypothetical protein
MRKTFFSLFYAEKVITWRKYQRFYPKGSLGPIKAEHTTLGDVSAVLGVSVTMYETDHGLNPVQLFLSSH